MEIGGLVVAMITCVIIFYAMPARIAKRHAVITSREGDRFAAEVTLVEPSQIVSDSAPTTNSGATLIPKPSTKPLFPAATHMQVARDSGAVHASEISRTKGTFMTAVPNTSEEQAPTSKVPAPPKRNPAHQMAALRSRRVARLAREHAAVQRRIVTASVATVLILLFTVLAALGVMAWAWLAIPGVFLGGTVASSIYGASRAQQQNREEIEELAQISLGSKKLREELAARTGSVPGPYLDKTPKKKGAQPKSEAPSAPGAEKVKKETSAQGSNIEISRAEDSAIVASQDALPVGDVEDAPSSSQTTKVSVVVEEVSQDWEVAPIPAPRYASVPASVSRKVHADTDLVPLAQHRGEGVPARPIRKSTTKPAEVAATADLTGPTFRFDLDAVLDQRRAQ